MSRESEKLYNGVTNIDDAIIERAQAAKPKRRRFNRKWTGPVAAALAIAVLAGVLLNPSGSSASYAIAEAAYPEQTTFVDYNVYFNAASGFAAASIPRFLSGAGDGNRVYSPLNVYMALSMLAEVTDGETRAQILDLLGAETVERQRERANLLWNENYSDEKQGKCVLASSLWLNEDVDFVQSTMDTLAENYYVSSYRGRTGSDSFNKALQDWLNEQTGDLLKRQAGGVELNPNTVMAIATTVYFRGKWANEFARRDTRPDAFHAPTGDLTCDFMHQRTTGTYFWGEHFAAVSQYFVDGRVMWYFLPDEGVSPDELLQDEEFLRFLTQGRETTRNWESRKNLFINLSVPKFDAVSDLDLLPGLEALGIIDALDWTRSDYTPMTTDVDEIYLAQAKHAARVTIDEEGCKAVAYTVMSGDNSASAPPDDETDFTLDRPFLFAIAGPDRLPLFVGVVNQP